MPRVSDAHKAERRAEIIDAARASFARNGFERTTLQDIFAEARLSAGAVYNYFKSKSELVLAIAAERHEEEARAMYTSSDDAIAALKDIAQRFIASYLAEGGDQKRRISVMTWSAALMDDAILKSVKEGVDEPRKRLTLLIERGQKSGAIRRDADVNALAAAMTAILQGLVLQKLWSPTLSASAMSKICEQLIDGLRAGSGRN